MKVAEHGSHLETADDDSHPSDATRERASKRNRALMLNDPASLVNGAIEMQCVR